MFSFVSKPVHCIIKEAAVKSLTSSSPGGTWQSCAEGQGWVSWGRVQPCFCIYSVSLYRRLSMYIPIHGGLYGT